MTYDELKIIFTCVSDGAHHQARGVLAGLPAGQLAQLAARARTVAALADEVRSSPRPVTRAALMAELDRLAGRP